MGQSEASMYPISISQIAQNQNFLNPSLLNQEEKWQISVFSKRYMGIFRNNSLSLLSASTRIPTKDSLKYHNLGMVLYYDKEGNYLNR